MNLKIHLVAVSAIILIVVIIFMASRGTQMPQAVPTEEPVGDRYIQISRATWGLNCNPHIEAYNNQQQTGNKYSAGPRSYPLVTPNNALVPVSDLCNGKLSCKIAAGTNTFGFDPFPNCLKMLEVEYRCFSYDMPWRVQGQDNKTLTLDCREEKQKATTGAPAKE